jgi:hypothetical protein
VGHQTWQAFVAGTDQCGHGVQIYDDVHELSVSVAAYLTAGFDLGESAVVVATADHLAQFERALLTAGWDHATLERNGLALFADADETLASFMDGDKPSPRAFERVVGSLLDEAATRSPGGEVRVFGEMVDILSRRGNHEGAVELEELWNDLAVSRSFSLLCAYELNVFDADAQARALPDLCRTHSHVRPAADEARFGRAVDAALEETLGYDHAGKVYFMVDRDRTASDAGVPVAQRVLMWLSSNMPVSADRVLAAARERYLARPLTATD